MPVHEGLDWLVVVDPKTEDYFLTTENTKSAKKEKAEAASCETASLFLQHMVDELVLVCHKVGSAVKRAV